MSAELDILFPSNCLEGFLFGRYPFCSLPCTIAKQVQLFSGLGIYSGTLVMYFQCQSNKDTGRTTPIILYSMCLLYALSAVSFISDLATLILVEVSNNSICSRNIIFYQLCSQISLNRFP